MQDSIRKALGSRFATCAAALAALLVACSTQHPAPALCTLEEGQLRVYPALASGAVEPRSTYGDRVGLGTRSDYFSFAWDRRGSQAAFFSGDDLVVASDGALKTFARSASGNVAPKSVVRAAWLGGQALRSSSGELIGYSDGGYYLAHLAGFTAASLASGQAAPAPAWQLEIPDRQLVSAALDESRDLLLVVLSKPLTFSASEGDHDANGIHARTVLRAYHRGATDPATFLWEVDLFATEGLSLGSVTVDQKTGRLYTVGWAPSQVQGQWAPAELLTYQLGDGAPVKRSRTLVQGPPYRWGCLYCGGLLSSREIGAAGSALQRSASGRLVLALAFGRLLGFDAGGQGLWLLETSDAAPDSHVTSFALDDSAGELAVLREHFSFEYPASLGNTRRSLAFYSYGDAAPVLRRVVDGALSAAARPSGLVADLESGEVLLTATAPAALTTFSIDAPDGAPALRSIAAFSVGALSSWTGARDGKGYLWTLANGQVLAFAEPLGATAQPVRFDLEASSLLVDKSRAELWLADYPAPDYTAVATVYSIAGSTLTKARAYAGAQAALLALDEARGEGWAGLAGLTSQYQPNTLSAYRLDAAAGAAPRITITLRGRYSGQPAVDPRRGELYVHVVVGGAGGTAPAADVVDVYDVVTGKLLRTLEGLAPEALAVCR